MVAASVERLWLRAVLVALLGALASCGQGGPTLEQDGGGAIRSWPGGSWGIGQTGVKTGATWSAGVGLCRTSPGVRPVLRSVVPVSLVGEIRLDSIGVRTVDPPHSDRNSNPATHAVGDMPGKPLGLGSPNGYEVPTTCRGGTQRQGEMIITLTKTGDQGGVLKGLRVTYTLGGETRVFVIDYEFGLCGTQSYGQACAPPGSTASAAPG